MFCMLFYVVSPKVGAKNFGGVWGVDRMGVGSEQIGGQVICFLLFV